MRNFLKISLTLLGVLYLLHSEEAKSKTVLSMSEPKESRYWRSINDNVMGGVSTGRITFLTDHALFSGEISLENNGGFSSVTRQAPKLSSATENVNIAVIGDGNTYQLRLTTYLNGYRLGYKHEFKTKNGTKQQLSLPIKDFIATFHGRRVWDAPELNLEKVRELGFLLANKKAGAFELKIYNINFD